MLTKIKTVALGLQCPFLGGWYRDYCGPDTDASIYFLKFTLSTENTKTQKQGLHVHNTHISLQCAIPTIMILYGKCKLIRH